MASNMYQPPSKKAKIYTNWTKCIKCQKDTLETLSVATVDAIDFFWAAVKTKQDDIFIRLQGESLSEKEIVWHKTCYKNYTHKTSLAPFLASPIEGLLDTQSSTRGASGGLDFTRCLFCKCKKRKGDTQLIMVRSFGFQESLSNAAKARSDHVMLARIAMSGNDLVAADARYHKGCHSAYLSERNIKASLNKAVEDDKKDSSIQESSFQNMLPRIKLELRNGEVLDMNEIMERFRSGSSDRLAKYSAQKIKDRLLNAFGDLIAFKSRGSKTELVYMKDMVDVTRLVSTDVDVDDPEDLVVDPVTEDEWSLNSDKLNTLFVAATILRTDITAVEGLSVNPIDSGDISIEKSLNLVPKSVYTFLKWVIQGTTMGEENVAPNSRCMNPQDHRHVLSVGQDLIHMVSHGNVKTPKHVGLAMAVRHQTGSSSVITMLNKLGHGSSYSTVERIDTGLGSYYMEQYAKNNVVIPSCIRPGLFTQVAADNNDLCEETLDGKNTTHSTTIVVYQNQSNVPQCTLNIDKGPLPRIHPLDTDDLYDMQQFHAGGRKPDTKEYVGKVKPEWFESKRSGTCSDDFTWTLLRRKCLDPSEEVTTEEQSVPSWSGFNAKMSLHKPVKSMIGYCPMMPASPTEYSTVYTVLCTVKRMMAVLGQKHEILTLDEAIFCKAREILWRRPLEFPNTILRLGGMHIALTFLAVLGKVFANSGLEDLLVESGVYAPTTAANLLKGKAYNRGIRAHKLVMEALERLLWGSFCKWVQKSRHDTTNTTFHLDDIRCNYDAAIQSFQKGNTEEQRAHVNSLKDILAPLEDQMQKFKDEQSSKSKLFKFWILYIDMVHILLDFIRAERDSIWDLHLSSCVAMLPFFHAFDRPNYARWLTVYISDMNLLVERAPEVYEQFKQGNHTVSRSGRPFSSVWTDMALEQSVNRDTKGPGGIIGISQRVKALNRWFLTCHQRSAIVTAVMSMCDMKSEQGDKEHKESGHCRIQRDETDVKHLLSSVETLMANPFEVEGDEVPLTNIATGIALSEADACQLISCKQLGEKLSNSFVNLRLEKGDASVYDPIPRQNIPTFAKLNKPLKSKTTKVKEIPINADRELFSRLLIASRTRRVPLREMFEHELSAVPLSLFAPDGSYRKTNKSALLSELEKCVACDIIEKLPRTSDPPTTIQIFDAMEIVQVQKPATNATFGDFASDFCNTVMRPFQMHVGISRVDVVFDRYDIQNSIKSYERTRRQNGVGTLEFLIHGPHTPVPKQWAKFIASSSNKARLTAFLATELSKRAQRGLLPGQQLFIGGGFPDGRESRKITAGKQTEVRALFTGQEEADTRMILHAHHAAQEGYDRIVVRSPDSDVGILLIYHHPNLKVETWLQTGIGMKSRLIPIHALATKRRKILSAVLGLHAISGCDTTSSLYGMGKVKILKLIESNPEKYCTPLSDLGNDIELSNDALQGCQDIVVALYGGENVDGGVDSQRYNLFCRRQLKNTALPPTSDSLNCHLKRVNYQCFVWKKSIVPKADIPPPIDNGWQLDDDGFLVPVRMTKDQAPSSVIELLSCNCSKSACTRRTCQCKLNEMPCIDSCKCSGSDDCQNPYKVEDDNEDASDDEEEESETED